MNDVTLIIERIRGGSMDAVAIRLPMWERYRLRPATHSPTKAMSEATPIAA
jgi:hypothetical protein